MYYASNHKAPLVNAREAEEYLQIRQEERKEPRPEVIAGPLLAEHAEPHNAPNECVVLGYN